MEWVSIKNYSKYEICGISIRNKKRQNIISQHKNSNGYVAVNIKRDDGVRTLVPLHRLIAIVYIPNPLNKSQVNHIDGNKLNNNLDNLEWNTLDENIDHAIRLGLIKSRNGNCRYSKADKEIIKNELMEITNKYNVSKWVLKDIIFNDM